MTVPSTRRPVTVLRELFVTARGRDRLTGVIMTAPAVVLFAVMMLVPLVLSGYLSLTDWDGYTAHPGMVGLEHYRTLLTDPEVRQAAWITALLTVVGTLAINVIGLALALAISAPSRLNTVLRTVFFYPYVISALIIGFLWSALLSTNGAVNTLLRSARHTGLPFLSQPGWALASLIAVVVWSGFGFTLVLYIAGLHTVPDSLLEAARIDGAGRFRTLRSVTLPMIAPVVTVNVVLTLVTLLRSYDLVLSLTGGGPAGTTQTAAYLILAQSFQNNALGYGSAQSMVLTVVTGIAALAITFLRRRADERAGA
ncbi:MULTISPECIES: carbohydrate ABC transporter permease [unclassified Streptomyces]|uniref:carbohydrate ABC transporter permease n=1 Tax=unclassified Streptomyces TaxID=2593676 RepID=UPI00225586DC|nr:MULTISPECIES: sugar ABC transporter permease [unclassified Streptomyces]MCX4404643.1 sugar ABC transporter permease [Streptomyces sp. NBC_01764]MCX5190813.1 sugar ABC transporter permease [Streptomyces sp. NBC_00268]